MRQHGTKRDDDDVAPVLRLKGEGMRGKSSLPIRSILVFDQSMMNSVKVDFQKKQQRIRKPDSYLSI